MGVGERHASKSSGDHYEQEAEKWANLRSGGTAFPSAPAPSSRPWGPVIQQKVSAAIMGGAMGCIAGSTLGVVGVLIQTGRLVGAGPAAAQAAAFMGTIFACGGAWQA